MFTLLLHNADEETFDPPNIVFFFSRFLCLIELRRPCLKRSDCDQSSQFWYFCRHASMDVSWPVELTWLLFGCIYGVLSFSLLIYNSFLIREGKKNNTARISVCKDDEPKVGHDVREMWTPVSSGVLFFPHLPFRCYKPAALLRTPSLRFPLPRVSWPALWPSSSRSPSRSWAAPPGSWWPRWLALWRPRTANFSPCPFSARAASSPGSHRGRSTGPTQPRSRRAAQSRTSWRLRNRLGSATRLCLQVWLEWVTLPVERVGRFDLIVWSPWHLHTRRAPSSSAGFKDPATAAMKLLTHVKTGLELVIQIYNLFFFFCKWILSYIGWEFCRGLGILMNYLEINNSLEMMQL